MSPHLEMDRERLGGFSRTATSSGGDASSAPITSAGRG